MRIFPLIILICLTGCLVEGPTHTGIFPRYKGSVSKALSPLEYWFIGIERPCYLWMKSNKDIRTEIMISSARFPDEQDTEDLNLNKEEVKLLRRQSIMAVRNYFGYERKALFYVLKKVKAQDKWYDLIDAQVKNSPTSLLEELVSKGLCILHPKFIRAHKRSKFLLNTQEYAQRKGIGIWAKSTSPNPNWKFK